MPRNTNIPRGIGNGEGGSRISKLEHILKEFDERISDLESINEGSGGGTETAPGQTDSTDSTTV